MLAKYQKVYVLLALIRRIIADYVENKSSQIVNSLGHLYSYDNLGPVN